MAAGEPDKSVDVDSAGARKGTAGANRDECLRSVILSEAKDLAPHEILRFAQNDIRWPY
jgi:hypothetical protein